MSNPTLQNLFRLIKESPNNPNLYSSRAKHYFIEEDYEKAIDDLSKAISLTNDQVRKGSLLAHRGEAYLNIGEPTLAIDDLTASKKIGGGGTNSIHRVYYLLGDANLILQNYSLSNEHFTHAIEIVHQIVQGKKVFTSQMEKEEYDSRLANYYYSRGRARSYQHDLLFLSLDDFEVAKSLFTDDQSKIDCYKEKCYAQDKLMKDSKDIDLWKYVSDLSYIIHHSSKQKDKFPFLVKRAKILHEVGNFEGCLADISSVFFYHIIQISSKDERKLRFIRAKILFEKKDYGHCLHDINLVIKNSTVEKSHYYGFRARLHESMDEKDCAIADYDECIRILLKNKSDEWKKNCHFFKKKIGDIYFEKKKYKKSLDERFYFLGMLGKIESGDSLDEDDMFLINDLYEYGKMLISLYEAKEDDDDDSKMIITIAVLVFVKLIKKFGNSGLDDNSLNSFYLNQGICRYHLKEYRSAIQDFTIIIEKDPGFEDGIPYFYRGQCHEEINNVEELINDLTTCLGYKNKYIGHVTSDTDDDWFRYEALKSIRDVYRA